MDSAQSAGTGGGTATLNRPTALAARVISAQPTHGNRQQVSLEVTWPANAGFNGFATGQTYELTLATNG